MKKTWIKQGLLAVMLLFAALLLGGCVSQIEEREMADLSECMIEADMDAPEKDGADWTTMTAQLFFLNSDASMLVPVTREIAVKAGTGRVQAVLDALLGGPQEQDEGVFWPELGSARSERFLEVSSGIATVDLPAHARTLSQEMLYAVRMAIAVTLTQMREVSYVNVLVGGREEGLDLGATLPVGTFSHLQEKEARMRYNRLNDQRQSKEGVTLLTTMYFPSADASMILPEVRSVHYAQVAPIEYLYTLLEELGKGSNSMLTCGTIPPPMDYIEEMPEIVRTEDGYVVIELQLSGSLDRALAQAGLTRGIYTAMLTDTLMSFVPGVEGLKISIDGELLTQLDALETPDGQEIVFGHGLSVRTDYHGYVGTPVTMYVKEDKGLSRVQYILAQLRAEDPRERLGGLMRLSQKDEECFALPPELTDEDILAVHMGRDAIAVNLSSAFARSLSSLSHGYERAAIYAMVNTLTEGTDISQVVFFFDGAQTETLAGGLEMRGSFMRNPGMVVN